MVDEEPEGSGVEDELEVGGVVKVEAYDEELVSVAEGDDELEVGGAVVVEVDDVEVGSEEVDDDELEVGATLGVKAPGEAVGSYVEDDEPAWGRLRSGRGGRLSRLGVDG